MVRGSVGVPLSFALSHSVSPRSTCPPRNLTPSTPRQTLKRTQEAQHGLRAWPSSLSSLTGASQKSAEVRLKNAKAITTPTVQWAS